MPLTYPLVTEKKALAFLEDEQHKPAITKALGEYEADICQFIREVISSLTGIIPRLLTSMLIILLIIDSNDQEIHVAN